MFVNPNPKRFHWPLGREWEDTHIPQTARWQWMQDLWAPHQGVLVLTALYEPSYEILAGVYPVYTPVEPYPYTGVLTGHEARVFVSYSVPHKAGTMETLTAPCRTSLEGVQLVEEHLRVTELWGTPEAPQFNLERYRTWLAGQTGECTQGAGI